MRRCSLLVVASACAVSACSAGLRTEPAAPHVARGVRALARRPSDPASSRRSFLRAIELRSRGATLSNRALWTALEGIGVSYLEEHRGALGLPWLRNALRLSEDIARTRYNLACARCQSGDAAGCLAELEATMHAAARAELDPSSPRGRRSPAYWALRARGDPDLAPLRRPGTQPQVRLGYQRLVHGSFEMRGMPASDAPADTTSGP